MKRGTDCKIHIHYDNVPLEDHHILPKEFGGLSVADNMARICANAHSDVHFFIALLMKFNGHVPWNIERTFGPKVRGMAQQGFNQIIAKPPAVVNSIRETLLKRHGLVDAVHLTLVQGGEETEIV